MVSIKRQVLFCTLGAIFEWYEFTIFVSLTPILSTLFFPQTSHFAAMMSTFAIFASGFISRPLGALFFGHLGDTIGRKYSLLMTILFMAVSTACIGLIPVGMAVSPILLVICRLLQGFSTSGEYPGSIALLAEHASPKHQSFAISFAVFGSGVGGVLGALIYLSCSNLLGDEAMQSYGWRIPFLMAIPIGFMGYWLRKTLLESSAFTQLKAAKLISKNPLAELFRKHSKKLLAALSICMLTNTTIYMNVMYLGHYALLNHKLTANEVTGLYLVVGLMYSLAIIGFGFLADYFSKKAMMTIGCLLILLFAYPLFCIVLSNSVMLQFFAQGLLAILVALVGSPFVAYLSKAFPIQVRFSGLSITLNMAASLFGGTAPIVCGWLVSVTASPFAPAFYLMGITLIALIAVGVLD